jgi:simple sugar transport system permease protein
LLLPAAVGAGIAFIVAFASIELHQEQVAIGFVLTLFAADLSSFLGNPYVNLPGPYVGQQTIPLLSDLPIIGPILFNQNLVIYASYVVIVLAWWWMEKTQPGLQMRGVGERPESAFARGVNVDKVRYLYTFRSALVGHRRCDLFTVVKLGWSQSHGKATDDCAGHRHLRPAGSWKVTSGAYLWL